MWTSCPRWVPARYVDTIDAIDAENSKLSMLFPSSEAGGDAAAAGSLAVVYGWGELDHLVPAYACTIQKSKGTAASGGIETAGARCLR